MTRPALTVDFDEVRSFTDRLIASMERNDITMQVGVPGCALAIGRLLSDLPMDEEQEVAFTQWIVDQIGMYFAQGGVN